MPHQRIVAGASATLDVWFTDQDGEPAAAGGDVTVGITRGDGSEVVAPATAAAAAAELGRYTYDLAAGTTQLLDLLVASWTDGTTSHSTLVEIVGGVYFTVGEARAAIESLQLADYPDAMVMAARRAVEDEFEAICGCAFVPRYRRVTIDSCTRWTVLPDPFLRTVRSVTMTNPVGDTPFTVEQMAQLVVNDTGLVTGVPYGRAVMEYECGLDRPPPEIKTAAFTRLRERLNFDRGGIPDRATSFVQAEGGNFRLDTADVDKTGNPEVDAALARWNFRSLVA